MVELRERLLGVIIHASKLFGVELLEHGAEPPLHLPLGLGVARSRVDGLDAARLQEVLVAGLLTAYHALELEAIVRENLIGTPVFFNGLANHVYHPLELLVGVILGRHNVAGAVIQQGNEIALPQVAVILHPCNVYLPQVVRHRPLEGDVPLVRVGVLLSKPLRVEVRPDRGHCWDWRGEFSEQCFPDDDCRPAWHLGFQFESAGKNLGTVQFRPSRAWPRGWRFPLGVFFLHGAQVTVNGAHGLASLPCELVDGHVAIVERFKKCLLQVGHYLLLLPGWHILTSGAR